MRGCGGSRSALEFAFLRPWLSRRRAYGKTLGVKDAERCHFGGSRPIQASLRGLQIGRRLLAPLGHDVVTDLLAFHKAAHAGALDRADVHEHVLAAVARLDESKAFLSIEELHGTCGHHGLLTLQLVYVSDHANIAWPVIQFWGSWLGTVKRERREADRKLVAGCYLCDRGRNVNPDSGINPAQAVELGNRRSRRGVEWHRCRRFAVEELAAVRALGAWTPVVAARDAESDCRPCDI